MDYNLAFYLIKGVMVSLIISAMIPLSIALILREYYVRRYPEKYLDNESHSFGLGCLFLVFGGFFGLHRFYYNRNTTGFVYLLTLGCLGIGWIYDLANIHNMHQENCRKISPKERSHSVAFLCYLFGNSLGIHRFYLGHWFSAIGLILLNGVTAYALDNWNKIDKALWGPQLVPNWWARAAVVISILIWMRELVVLSSNINRFNEKLIKSPELHPSHDLDTPRRKGAVTPFKPTPSDRTVRLPPNPRPTPPERI